MTGAIRKQLAAFLEGFYDIIPRRWSSTNTFSGLNFTFLVWISLHFPLLRLIAIFNEQELELLLSGLPDINIDDLKANTEYHKYSVTSLQIVWWALNSLWSVTLCYIMLHHIASCYILCLFRFWRALRSFDQTDRAKFLQFVTGSSKVPLQVHATTYVIFYNLLNSEFRILNSECHSSYVLCRALAPWREWMEPRSSKSTGMTGRWFLYFRCIFSMKGICNKLSRFQYFLWPGPPIDFQRPTLALTSWTCLHMRSKLITRNRFCFIQCFNVALFCRPMTSCAPTCWRRSKSAQKDLALPNFDPRVPKGALIQRVLMAILPVFDFPCWSGQSAVWSSDRTYKKIMIPTVMILRREPIYTRRKRTRLLFGFYHLKTVLNCFFRKSEVTYVLNIVSNNNMHTVKSVGLSRSVKYTL